MKVSELTPEQKAELQTRYKEAGLKGSIQLMTIEKVEAKIAAASGNEVVNTVVEEPTKKELTFDIDVFKTVKKVEDGREFDAQVNNEFKFKKCEIAVKLVGKLPAGQSNLHPKNSFMLEIESEKFVMSAELAAKIFELKV